jgi:ATP-binding cassette subfamily F protein 3
VIVVSHDRSFLNEVCTDTIEFKDRKLNYYKGDYDTYVRTSEENIKNAMRVYQAYKDKREHMMEFITRFRAAANRAKLVQSRIKAVEKMDLEAPEEPVVEQLWRFSIPNPGPLGRPIIAIDDVWFDYSVADDSTVAKKPKEEWILQQVNFGIDLDSRLGILGPNGAGKSTLLNLIMDRLTPNKGTISRNGNLRIGHFTQHSADKFDLQLSAVENMLNIFEKADDQGMRSFLGKFQIQNTDALKPMMMLSGGQKSRVAFASLAYQQPHVIVMDEPTNHLDMESIDALVEAVQDFNGGLIVVSHDEHFITSTCKELWVVGNGVVSKCRGDFTDYKKETLKRTEKRIADSVKSLSVINN